MSYKTPHFLVAYICQMKYMGRLCPAKDKSSPFYDQKLAHAIDDGEQPNIGIEKILKALLSAAREENGVRFSDSDQVLSFASFRFENMAVLDDGTQKLSLEPAAGAVNRDFVFVDLSNPDIPPEICSGGKAALFSHDVFFYQKGLKFIAIFHKVGASACKTVFMNAVNKVFRDKSMRLDMNIIYDEKDFVPESKITPICLDLIRTVTSSRIDVADQLSKGSKTTKRRDRDLRLYFDGGMNNPFRQILRKFRLLRGQRDIAEITQSAIDEIRAALPENDQNGDFTDVKVTALIGETRRARIVDLEEFLEMVGEREITNALSYGPDGRAEPNSLAREADEYYRVLEAKLNDNE
jgi:hypothetical protein